MKERSPFFPWYSIFKRAGVLFLLALFCLLGSVSSSQAQVATYYNFSQSSGTYTPIVADFPSTPASIYTTTWDDIAYSFPIPFDFTYNGTLYPASTGYIGLDTDGWLIFSNGVPTMTGQTGGGSWVSISDHTGVYLWGTANFNGFAGLNCDLNNNTMATFTANVSNGSNVLTSVSSVANITVGTRLSGTGIPNGTVVISNTANTITMSANATANSTGATITPYSSIYYKVTGTAPNRKLVVQWTQAKRYGGTGVDNFNFQMILNEGGGLAVNQTLQVVYGGFSATSVDNLDAQVGLRGASSADFNARKSTTGWAATTLATANTDIVRLNNTIFPASGLTFTWSPCTAPPGAAGAISGSTTVCPSSSQTYSLTAVSGATSYNWTYSGTGASFSATTTTPSNTFTFSLSPTAGTITVTPVNLCGSGASSNLSLTVTSPTLATISYPAASYCSNVTGTIAVTRTGPAGGTYSTNPVSGLTINASTGDITPSTSTAGAYSVIYSYSSSGCSLTASTTVTILEKPTVTATTNPSTICAASSSQLQATVTNLNNYTVSSISYSSLTPSGTPTTLWNVYTDDAVSTAIPMPFSFTFYGSAITQFYVSTNGHIQLQTSSGSATAEQTLPDATTPNNVIALAWDDLVVDPSSNPGCYIRYFLNGTAPNRIMVIEYYNLRFLAGSGQNVTGQIRLYESDNHIEVAAGTVNDNGSSRTKTLGIENSTGTLGLSPTGRNNAVWNTSNEAWSFFPPNATYTYSWSPATFLSSTSISNPVASGVTATTAYTVTVTNTTTGCVNTANTTLTFSSGLSGTYTVGPAGNYTTLTAAINAYNTQCISGPIVFSLIGTTYTAGETFPIIIKKNGYASAVNTLTIRPASGVTASISGSAPNNALIKVIGNYVTIDGSNNGTTSRDLTITNTSTTTPTVVQFASGNTTPVTNGTIKNCNLVNGTNTSGSYASTLSLSDSTIVGDPGYFNNITAQNNNIQKGEFGIDVVAVKATGNGSSTLITQNLINSSGANAVSELGIYLEGVEGATISQNDVGNFNGGTAEVDKGIWVALGSKNVTVSQNTVHDLIYTGTSGYTGQGIVVSTGESNCGVSIINNMLYNFRGDGDSYTTFGSSYTPAAIRAYGSSPSTQTGLTIYFNSIYMDGQTLNKSNALAAGIALDDNNTANVRNNIIYNKMGRVTTTGIGNACIALENAASQLTACDYNVFYFTDAPGSGFKLMARVATTNHLSLVNWRTATSLDPNSYEVLPVFTSTTNLHLVAASNISISNKGTPISGITGDYDVQSRNALTPDIGCDEWVEPNKGSWIGLVSIDWLTAANWEANFVPDGTTDVFITGGYTFMPTVTTTQAIRNLSLSAPGSPSNIPILTLSNGTLQINGTITRTGGSINGSNGTVQMSGTAAQTIPASLFQNNNLKNLIIGNTNSVTGVSLGGPLDIYGSVTFNASGLKLTTNDNLTFKSTLTGTAWLGNVTGKTIVGNATVERYIPSGVNHGKSWQYVAVPLSGTQTINQAWQDTATAANQSRYAGFGTQLVSNISPLPTLFDASGVAPSVKTYNPATNQWVGVANTTSTAIANKRGYMVFVRGDRTVTTVGGAAVPTVLRAKGKLYTTGADLPPSTTVLANKYESIGNPYASAIDFLTITKPPASQVDDAFYVWDPLRYGSWGYGAYQTISSVNGYKPVPGGTANYSALVTNTRIESGQAFMVHATGPSSGGTISFSETAKLTGSQMVFRQPDARLQERQFINTSLHAINGQLNYLADACVVAMDTAFESGYDANDALKILNPGENIGIQVTDQVVAIEARKPVGETDTVHYFLGNLRRQTYEFRFRPEKMENTGLLAFLFDRMTQQYHPVSLTDSTTVSFVVNDQPSSSASNRFILVFRQLRPVPVILADISARRTGEYSCDIQWKVEQETDMQEYVLERSLDGTGFEGINTRLPIGNSGGQATYEYPDNQASSGVNYYRVRALSRNGQVQYSRIVRVAPFGKKPVAMVYPNPVTDGIIRLELSNQPAGAYPYQLFNALGQLVHNGTLTINSSHTVERIDMKERLASGIYQLKLSGPAGNIIQIAITIQ